MNRADWMWGIGVGLGLGLVGFGLRGLGVAYPLEGLFAQITYWLGTPAMFNLIHGLFGYGELTKNLAFAGAALLWLLLHPFLWWTTRRRLPLGLLLAFGVYATSAFVLPGGWVAAGLYTALFAGLVLAVRRGSKAARTSTADPARRESLKALGVLAVGLALWGEIRAQAKIVWEKIAGLWPELIGQPRLYQVSKNPAFLDPNLLGRPYRLEIGGLVNRPFSLGLEEIKALPSVELIHTMACISNPIGGDLIGCLRWRGVLLKTLLERAGVRAEAKFIVWEAADRYTESIALAEVPPEAMLAYAAENPETGEFEDLEPKHGYPTRILLPGRYGMKQPKWLTKITLSDREVTGYWAQRGWSKSAEIRTMSRIDTPRQNARLRAGEEIFVAGIAYAGGRPLERVEVSFDGGKTWQKAQLRPPRARYAWQQWALPWKPQRGDHTLQVRAVEVSGRIQDATVREPLPDGATGYHTLRVRVG
ncbi:molybdopterin-dependent oxidoreductase [Calidithermus timidus]|jgi:DMSO/TMAO reductase YedYZ molybdopterin-dependent catalytic subunit|uniref:molybdopterin-dependent oxidoreductase n=1 Tax=Calidithermus timidus TaxID=307124 RepID=UPI000374B52A|nr:molybdopterin-dependent oxidoreductase [Calidithermus timidus]